MRKMEILRKLLESTIYSGRDVSVKVILKVYAYKSM